jgi:hypothetical protein
VSERKLGILSKIKEGENYNHRNTFKYFEDYNLSLTQRLGKITVFGRALVNQYAGLLNHNKEQRLKAGGVTCWI